MDNKIAFLFLTMKGAECSFIWDDFFLNADKNKYKIFCHPKHPDQVHDFLKPHIIPELVPTEWGQSSLVKATFLMYKQALLDPSITHFILLSHDAAPVTNFSTIYNKLGNNLDKGYLRIDINNPSENLYNCNRYHWQWTILTRNLAQIALLHEDLIFLYYNLCCRKTKASIPFILDEHWIFVLINRILNKDLEEFFIDTSNCKTYRQRMHSKRLSNLEEYYHYFRRYYNDPRSVSRFSTACILPRLHSINEYMSIRESLAKDGYFFMRKVYGTKEEYIQLKNHLKPSSKDSLSDDFIVDKR
jgi:hypothetical protein